MANEAYLYDTTDGAAWMRTVYLPAVQGYWKENLSIAQACTDLSSLVPAGASTISIPRVPLTAAVTKTSGTPLVLGDPTDLASGGVTRTTHKALAYCIEDALQMSTHVPIFEQFKVAAGDALAFALDTVIAGVVKGETTLTAITTGTDDTITYQNLLTAQKNLNNQRIKIRNCAMAISPEAFELSIIDWADKFMSASYRNAAEPGFWYSGVEGKILGMQVFVSDDWDYGGTAETATIWAPQAMAFATTPVMMVGPVPDTLNVGMAFTMHMLMGAQVQSAYGVQAFLND